jgi:hypothetical protein
MRRTVFILVILVAGILKSANPEQMPGWMKKMSFEAGPAYIQYPFSSAQLNPGFSAREIVVPNIAFKMGLSYRINPYLSAKMSYLMPSAWVSYTVEANNNTELPDETPQHSVLTRPVWMNYAGFTLNGHLRISDKLEAMAEAGSALVTRKGFASVSNQQIIDHATYFAPLIGAGLQYSFHDLWSVVASGGWIPASVKYNQPRTTYASVGIRFQPPSGPTTTKQPSSTMTHPRQWLQVGYSSNSLGYGVNNFITGLRIFWGGRLQVEEGIQLQYQRNIFHTPRWFAIDWGIHAARWSPVPLILNGQEIQENFYTLSVYPVFRLNFLQTTPADLYFFYSVAGPGFISRSTIHEVDLGEQFIFTDTMGFGAFAGKKRRLALELRIGHYSNGNMFPSNSGVKVPLTLLVGTTF